MAQAEVPVRNASAGKPVMRTHTVRKGDTLSRVAKLYNVKVADIRRWNENAEPLMPGSKLAIPILAS
jgi:LysM repeat protein